jgi:hypothetical protein
MKIANIVSADKITAPQEFNVVSSIDDIIIGLPTLIIGYNYVNKHYPNFDIGEILISDNVYWTFKRTEKRDKHSEDLNWFILKVYGDLLIKLSYIFVDPIQYKPKTLVKIIRKILNISNKIAYLSGSMVYIYGHEYVFGIDLKLLEFVGLDTNKIMGKIRLSCDTLLTDDTVADLRADFQIFPNVSKYIPYLFSLRNA